MIEQINKLFEGINKAYSRSAFSMTETYELYIAMEQIRQFITSQQEQSKAKESESKTNDDSKQKKGN